MKKGFVVILLLVGFVILPAAGHASLPGFVSGYVIDAETGDEIGGATITSNTSGSTASFSDGYFILAVVPGSQTITASKAGYESKKTPDLISITAGESVIWNASLTPRQPGPPDTAITNRPRAFAKITSATFGFASNEGSATFQCKIDAGTYTACTSPKTYPGPLTVGTHKFYVKATDVSGNVDLSPAVATWTIDLTPPQTTITPTCSNGDCTFEITSTEAGSAFRCKLDTDIYEVCTSPVIYTGLSAGWHTLRVKAVDKAGNSDPTPAVYQWY